MSKRARKPREGEAFVRIAKPGTNGADKYGKICLMEAEIFSDILDPNTFTYELDGRSPKYCYESKELVWDEERRAWKFREQPWNMRRAHVKS